MTHLSKFSLTFKPTVLDCQKKKNAVKNNEVRGSKQLMDTCYTKHQSMQLTASADHTGHDFKFQENKTRLTSNAYDRAAVESSQKKI